MRVLFVTQNYPPDVNAPANRARGLATEWSVHGGDVEILTGVPCYPDGILAPLFRNRFVRGLEEGVRVTRVPHLVLANRGALRRILLYGSFMLSAVAHALRSQLRPDVVVGTSPHLFTALAALVISRLRRVPFVMEIRDLWPESIVASDVLPAGHWVVRGGKVLAQLLHRHADHVVVNARSFGRMLESQGVEPSRITFLPNGADVSIVGEAFDERESEGVRRTQGLNGHFVASYIGTVGKAHRADLLYEAAELSDDPDLIFMVVGPGAERPALERRLEARPLPNFRLVDKQPRERALQFLQASDVSVVCLKDRPLFQTVIPSKIFEAMAAGKPIVLGVRGEAQKIVESTGAGIVVEPESPRAVLEALRRLRDDPKLYRQMSENGRRAAREHFDRAAIARRYWELLARVAASPT